MESGRCFALFRLPGSEQVQLIMHDNERSEDRLEEEGRESEGGGPESGGGGTAPKKEPRGFVFAPFSNSSHLPTLLIRPDIVANGWEEIAKACMQAGKAALRAGDTCMDGRAGNASPNQTGGERDRSTDASPNLTGGEGGGGTDASPNLTGGPVIDRLDHAYAGSEDASRSPLYAENLERMLAEIRRGTFEKLVLSYCQRNTTQTLLHREADTFLRALDTYPNAMVYLVYTTTAGRWMGCTPEILLKGENNMWETMALAGTHENKDTDGPATERAKTNKDTEWDTKNIEEQNVVSQYIKATLQDIATDIQEEGPYTMQAGNLVHRRTDFRFTSRKGTSTTDIINALHPTPAVCGFPKKEALLYLNNNEHSTRNYFSGYLGPMNINGRTCIYVNLRCAQICSDATYYHAGGGLNRLSVPEEEMQEIERKMETMRALLT